MRGLFRSLGGGGRQDVLLSGEAVGEELDARVAYNQSGKRRAGRNKQDGVPKRGGGKVKGGGQALGGFNCRAGQRDQCYRCDSEYHLGPKCPRRDPPGGDRGPAPLERDKARRPSYSSISTDTPVSARKAEHLKSDEAENDCDHSFFAALDMGGLFMAPEEDSAVALDTGAMANLVCFRWLDHHNQLLE